MAKACAVGMCLAVLPALSFGAEGLEAAIKYGQDGSAFDGAGLAFRPAPWWSRDLGNWKATWRPEVEFNHFRYGRSGAGQTALNEVGASGLFRAHYGSGAIRPYGEIGLGVALLSEDRLGPKQLSTRYQFNEYVGLGVEFSDRWFAGLRFAHYSNADIKKPNAGLDLQQIVIGIRF